MKTYLNWVKLQVAAATDKDRNETEYFSYDTNRPTAVHVDAFQDTMGDEGLRMLRAVYQQTKVANRSAATSKSDKVSPEELQCVTLNIMELAIANGKTFAEARVLANATAASVAQSAHGTLAKVSKREYMRICAVEDFIIKEVFAGHDEADIARHLEEFNHAPDAPDAE